MRIIKFGIYAISIIIFISCIIWFIDFSNQAELKRHYQYNYIDKSYNAIYQRYRGNENVKDAWGNIIQVKKIDKGYYIYSCGLDGISNTEDDFGLIFSNLLQKRQKIPYTE